MSLPVGRGLRGVDRAGPSTLGQHLLQAEEPVQVQLLGEEVLPEEGKCVKPAALFLARSLSLFLH